MGFWLGGMRVPVERRVRGDVAHPRASLGGLDLQVFPRRIGNVGNTRGRESDLGDSLVSP
jgi:hypothetical protein